MAKMLSKAEMLDLISRKARAAGSQRALAEALGVTPAFLSDVLHGHRSPGPKLLQALGLREVTLYVRARSR